MKPHRDKKAIARLQHRWGCTDSTRYSSFVGHAGDVMVRCLGCDKAVPYRMLTGNPGNPGTTEPQHRYVLECCRCGREMYPPNARKRVPLCPGCKARRQAQSEVS